MNNMKNRRLSPCQYGPIFLAMNTLESETPSNGGDPMAYTHANTYAYHRHAPLRAATGLVGRAIDTVLRWQERIRGRKELQRLDDRLLKDIGINRIDALREANKPFWKR
jgi:uncharacterized protein YjiS (DUF1127 family)